VELAASMAQMASLTLRRNFRRIDPAKSSFVLLDGADRVLPSYAETLSKKAAGRLEKLGVKAITGVKVERVDAQGIVAGGKRIASATVLWTAGVTPSPVVKKLGAKTDRAGRVIVGPFMNVREMPGVYVVGDTASVMRDGPPLPGVAQVAIQQGHFVGRLISRHLKGRNEAPVSILRQGKYGGHRQELRGAGEGSNSNERISDLARLGVYSSDISSSAAEQATRPNPVAVVLLYRTARLAADFRSWIGWEVNHNIVDRTSSGWILLCFPLLPHWAGLPLVG
jgi:hypothetical protein